MRTRKEGGGENQLKFQTLVDTRQLEGEECGFKALLSPFYPADLLPLMNIYQLSTWGLESEGERAYWKGVNLFRVRFTEHPRER